MLALGSSAPLGSDYRETIRSYADKFPQGVRDALAAPYGLRYQSLAAEAALGVLREFSADSPYVLEAISRGEIVLVDESSALWLEFSSDRPTISAYYRVSLRGDLREERRSWSVYLRILFSVDVREGRLSVLTVPGRYPALYLVPVPRIYGRIDAVRVGSLVEALALYELHYVDVGLFAETLGAMGLNSHE